MRLGARVSFRNAGSLARSRRSMDDPKPTPPDKPLPMECCESGCAVCVFDRYAEAYAAYKRALADWKARQAPAG